MGGRGSAGKGITVVPKYFAETEKAVKLKILVEDYDLEETDRRIVWVPKSQLADDGRPSLWITEQKAKEFYSWERSRSGYSVEWEDASGKRFQPTVTKKENEYAREKTKKAVERFNAGKESYNALVAEAKTMGIKGVRVGMKRKTIEEKIRKHKGG